MYQAGLLLIIRKYYSVNTAIGICHVFMLTGCWQDRDPSRSCQRRTRRGGLGGGAAPPPPKPKVKKPVL